MNMPCRQLQQVAACMQVDRGTAKTRGPHLAWEKGSGFRFRAAACLGDLGQDLGGGGLVAAQMRVLYSIMASSSV